MIFYKITFQNDITYLLTLVEFSLDKIFQNDIIASHRREYLFIE